MYYWLYSTQTPEYGKPEFWAIYIVNNITWAQDHGEDDIALVADIVYDKFGLLNIGDKSIIHGDAITADGHRVIMYLFEQRFR